MLLFGSIYNLSETKGIQDKMENPKTGQMNAKSQTNCIRSVKDFYYLLKKNLKKRALVVVLFYSYKVESKICGIYVLLS